MTVLSILLVLHFFEWFIYSMPVNPVSSVDDVISHVLHMLHPWEKAAICLTFYYFSCLLSSPYSLHKYLFQTLLRHLFKNIYL